MNDGKCNVFITGATGFVGAYLLHDLLSSPLVNTVYV